MLFGVPTMYRRLAEAAEAAPRLAHALGGARLLVSDTGTGIAPEDMQRLFQPFFRADRSRTRQTGGLGLGLLLTRRILEAHRGTLEIESKLGEGTLARIRVPVIE